MLSTAAASAGPLSTLLSVSLGLTLLAGSVAAQTVAAQGGSVAAQSSLPSNANWKPSTTRPAIQTGSDVTFDLMSRAPSSWDYTTVQVRRFIDPQHRLVQIRERLEVRGDYTAESPFQLVFLAAIGGSSADNAKWRDTYKATSGLIHLHHSFGVRDVAAATANYSLSDWGSVTRAGRSARRVIVFPNRVDKGIWVVDLDCQTGLPLYRAVYSPNGGLLSELEVQGLTVGGIATGQSSGWGWQPRLTVQRFSSAQSARLRLPGRAIQPELAGLAGEYVPSIVQMTTDPVNGDQSLVLGYTDGVDEFFVIEDFNTIDPLQLGGSGQSGSGLAAAGKGSAPTHFVASYDDASMRIYVFHDRGTTYQLAGSSALVRLKDVAESLCHQAVTAK